MKLNIMKLKNLILAAVPLLAFVSCDDIAPGDRYTELGHVEVKRAVLIEDFTGQNCPNCPKAHETIHKLMEQYGDAIIPVALHAGAMAIKPSKHYVALRQDDADYYNDRYGITAWPKGVVNKSSGVTNHDAWTSLVRDELQKMSDLDIALKATASADLKTVDVECVLKPADNISGTLQLWVLEDSIVARQQDIDLGRIDDYVHNHVFRATVNGRDGEAVTLTDNTDVKKTYTVAVKETEVEKWVTSNLSIVAFVYDGNGVVQAAKANVSVSANE